jgi:hypothetical protein
MSEMVRALSQTPYLKSFSPTCQPVYQFSNTRFSSMNCFARSWSSWYKASAFFEWIQHLCFGHPFLLSRNRICTFELQSEGMNKFEELIDSECDVHPSSSSNIWFIVLPNLNTKRTKVCADALFLTCSWNDPRGIVKTGLRIRGHRPIIISSFLQWSHDNLTGIFQRGPKCIFKNCGAK